MRKPRLVGLNHVALEVGDVEEALRFYGAVFSFELRGRHDATDEHPAMAFLDMGDQFVALMGGREQPRDDDRHFGLVVDDRTSVMELAEKAGATILDRPFNFRDPWGNHLEIVAYADVQYTKAGKVLRGMGLDLAKTDEAREELRKKVGGADDEQALREVIERRAAAVGRGDADGMTVDTAEDVTIFDVVPPFRAKGRDAARKRATEWLASYRGTPRWEVSEVEVSVGGRVGFAHMISHVTGTMRDGKAVDMWFRTTLGFERRDGRWLIVHDHGSDPFDPSTGKAVIDGGNGSSEAAP